MYQLLLTTRYLTTKVMPLLAVGAVLLCTAMVVIVWSIMGGFLILLLDSGRTLVGDVLVTWPVTGFAHYDQLVDDLEREEGITAATPTIETFAMIELPDGRIEGVSVKGVDPATYSGVTGYADTLWWRKIEKPLPKDTEREDVRLETVVDWARFLNDGISLEEYDPRTGRVVPACVLGIQVSGFNQRRPSGAYLPMSYGRRTEQGAVEWSREFMLHTSVTLNLLPLDRKGRSIDVATWSFPVANEFRSGLFEIDKSTVIVPLATLQQLLKMDAAERIVEDPTAHTLVHVDPASGDESFPDPAVVDVAPARVTTVLVKGDRGLTPLDVKARVERVYQRFAEQHAGRVPDPASIKIQTWEETQGTLIAAVKKEIALVLGIIVFISFVASVLILAIFWAMVSEKTKDIGTLRAIGAGELGVAGVWLAYGFVIGVVGSALGGVLAWIIVRNINPIHDWLGRAFGLAIWDPKVYYFSEIPNHVEPQKLVVVLAGGVFFSVLGAAIPAARAARMDPVRSLRFE